MQIMFGQAGTMIIFGVRPNKQQRILRGFEGPRVAYNKKTQFPLQYSFPLSSE